MGNNPSTHSKSSSVSPASSTHGQHPPAPTGTSPAASSERRREPKLRDSIHGQKGAPPESSQVQARGTTTTHRIRQSQNQQQQPSSQPPSYAQAQAQSQSHSHSNSPSQSQSQSPRQYSPFPPQPLTQSQNASPANSTPYSASPKEKSAASKQLPQAPETQSHQNPSVKSSIPPQYRDLPSKPVAVPQPVNTSTTVDASNEIKSPYGALHSEHASVVTDTMSYHLTRPPRLPLPIEEEVHTPGSPILGPADAQTPLPDLDPLEMGETLTRPLSSLSNETEDEDAEELPIDKSKPTVETVFTWHGDPNVSKVYVTGTIFQWSAKAKLSPVSGKPGYFQCAIRIRPGTHHIRFIVDGNMSLSPDLPTTVDFGNNLVNYIEVSADDAQPHPEEQSHSQDPEQSQQGRLERNESHQEESHEHPGKQPQRTKAVPGREHYTSAIPQYLLDLDKAEDSAAYQYAAAAIVKLPTPPSLPGFLGKPILNAATPMKDDNSVLNMPNHTVLNHLATSSIKGNVLAVSATTRYKRKYVTTIMYKPTSDDTT